VLEVRNIDVFYGDVQVIWDISFEIKQGEVVALIGANGAGKSTTLKTVSGLLKPRKGAVSFNGVNQANPIAGFAGKTGTGTNASLTVASAPGGVVIDAVATAGAGFNTYIALYPPGGGASPAIVRSVRHSGRFFSPEPGRSAAGVTHNRCGSCRAGAA